MKTKYIRETALYPKVPYPSSAGLPAALATSLSGMVALPAEKKLAETFSFPRNFLVSGDCYTNVYTV